MLDRSDPRRDAQFELQAIARDASYLNELRPDLRMRLIAAGSRMDYPEGSPILIEGAEIESVHVVLRGIVAVSLCPSLSPSMWLYHSGPGTVVDMCALLEPPVSPMTVKALTVIEVLAIPRNTLVDVLEEQPLLASKVLRDLASRLAMINRVVLKEVFEESPGPSNN